MRANSFVTTVSIPIERVEPNDRILTNQYFQFLQSGNLTLPLGCNGFCIPVDPHDFMSIISYTLNSVGYFGKILKNLDFQSNPQLIEDTLLSSADDEDYNLEINFSSLDSPEIELLGNLTPEIQKIYGDKHVFSLNVFYPKQFEAIRSNLHKDRSAFILSLSRSLTQIMAMHGKSGARFHFSHDERYILKFAKTKEFRMFLEMAPSYFRHINLSMNHSMPSIMAKILGAYKIKIENTQKRQEKTRYVLLQENVGFNLLGDHITFDLKGTTNPRRKAKPGVYGQTKMDVDFVRTHKALPISLKHSDKTRQLDYAIMNDSYFLCN